MDENAKETLEALYFGTDPELNKRIAKMNAHKLKVFIDELKKADSSDASNPDA